MTDGFFIGIGLAEDEPGNNGMQLNEYLQNELLFFAGLGIRSVCRWDKENIQEYPSNSDLRIQARDTNIRSLKALSHKIPSSTGDRVDLDPVVNVDVIVAKEKETALSEELRGSLSETAQRSPRGPSRDFLQNIGRMFEGSRPEAMNKPKEELNGNEVRRLKKENHLQDEQLAKITFRTYHPGKFRELRKLFGVDVAGDSGRGALHEAMAQHKPGSFDGGASGAFMYSSNDGRFIVKQITQKELDVLLRILDGYTRHMRAPIELNVLTKKGEQGDFRETGEAGKGKERKRLEGLPVAALLLETDQLGLSQKDHDGKRTEYGLISHLPRLLQCNRIQMYHSETRCCQNTFKGGRLYFMVMENTFHSHVMREVEARQMRGSRRGYANVDALRLKKEVEDGMTTFDLKGSSVNRSTLPFDWLDDVDPNPSTMKDLDLREKLYLSQEDADALVEQLKADTKFLLDNNIMDYSLLLGIQKGVNGNRNNVVAADVGPAALGRLEAVAAHSAQRYYVGIIDILQTWEFPKTWEPWAKSVLGPSRYENFDAYELSAVDPTYYRKRFIIRMQRHIEAKQMAQMGLGSTHATVERITANLGLDQSQRGKLAERVGAADGGDITASLVMSDGELRRRTGSDKTLSPSPRAVGGGAFAPVDMEPEPEPEPEWQMQPEPEPELEPEPEPEPEPVGVSRPATPPKPYQSGGAE